MITVKQRMTKNWKIIGDRLNFKKLIVILIVGCTVLSYTLDRFHWSPSKDIPDYFKGLKTS